MSLPLHQIAWFLHCSRQALQSKTVVVFCSREHGYHMVHTMYGQGYDFKLDSIQFNYVLCGGDQCALNAYSANANFMCIGFDTVSVSRPLQ